MRPAPVNAKPFFRPEAEDYRRLRHLGEVELFRPLSVRMIAALPLLCVAVLGVIAMSIKVAPKVDLVEVATVLERGRIALTLNPTDEVYFVPGDRVELIGVDASGSVPALILTTTQIACPSFSPTEPSRRMPSAQSCMALTLRLLAHAGSGEDPVSISSVRAAPRRYFAFAN